MEKWWRSAKSLSEITPTPIGKGFQQQVLDRVDRIKTQLMISYARKLRELQRTIDPVMLSKAPA